MPEFEYTETREPTPDEINQKLEREQRDRSYIKFFSTPDGKIILKDILTQCNIFHLTFRSHNPKEQDFLEGKRAIGLYLIARIPNRDLAELKELNDAKAI